MRLQIVSDLHLDFHADLGTSLIRNMAKVEPDVLIIAGDLASGAINIISSINKILAAYPSSYILYVLGNHEFYGPSSSLAMSMLGEISEEDKRLILLQNRSIGIEGRKFVGTTLWFDTEDLSNFHRMADFHEIEGAEYLIPRENKAHKDYLNSAIKEGDIVITHHVPSPQLIDPQYVGSVINPYFYSDMTGLIEEKKPALWIYGHTHIPNEAMIGETKMICNPLGYPHESEEFNIALEVEV